MGVTVPGRERGCDRIGGIGGGGGSSAVDASGTEAQLLEDVREGDGLVLISHET